MSVALNFKRCILCVSNEPLENISGQSTCDPFSLFLVLATRIPNYYDLIPPLCRHVLDTVYSAGDSGLSRKNLIHDLIFR